jgi:4-amino-4-deoxy-L-arabinose transferase-like glycosyltransferase
VSLALSARRVLLAAVPLAIWALRLVIPARGLDVTGPRALVDAALAILLAAWLLTLAFALGGLLLRAVVRKAQAEGSDRFVLAAALGFGALGLGFLLQGVLGGFRPGWIAIALSAAGYIVFGGSTDPILELRAAARKAPASWRAASMGTRSLLVAAVVIGLLSSVQALAPTWDYDGLMYHLQAPRLFLEAGRLTPLPEIWQANGPLTIEMLYGAALGLQSEPTARLLHLMLACLLVLATYALSRSELGETGGVLAAAVLLGIPIFPIWGTLAYADMGWALFECLMLFALVRWSGQRDSGWLVVGGLFAGLAASSKYLGLAGFLSGTALVLLIEGVTGIRALPRSLARFMLPALAVCAPWYLRNAIWLGDPVYPFLSGNQGTWGDGRLSLLMTYLQSFGDGTSPLDFLLLPLRLYSEHGRFGTFMSSIEFPSFLFPLALLLLVARPARGLRLIGVFVLLRFGAWALGSQQTRFLLPVFPALSVLTAAAMLWLGSRPRLRPFARVAGMGFVGGMVAVTIAYQLIYFGSIRPGPVVLGLESRRSFLNRAVYDFEAARYVVERLPVDARVLMLWDGQGYYCDERCLPDTAQSRAPYLMLRASASPWPAIGDSQITHVLIDLEGANFMVQHDPTGQHQASLEYIRQALNRCGELILSTEKTLLYAWQCDSDISTLNPQGSTAGSSGLQTNIIRSIIGQARER